MIAHILTGTHTHRLPGLSSSLHWTCSAAQHARSQTLPVASKVPARCAAGQVQVLHPQSHDSIGLTISSRRLTVEKSVL